MITLNLSKPIKLSIFLVLVIFIAVATFFILSNRKSDTIGPPPSNDTYDYRAEKAKLTKEFQVKSASQVYQEFKDRYKNIDRFKIHNLAHWIGTEIYVKSGMGGLLVCDEAFDYGCYHGFFIKAFEKEGKNLYSSGDKHCFGDGSQPLKYGGCIHGLGHGVLYLNGYDENGLISALKDCESLSSESSIDGCNNGVFMEFNTRTMQSLDSGDIKVREYNPQTPDYPCSVLDLKYKADCYYEIPAWWSNVINSDFIKMISFCQLVTDKESQNSCFGGVGRMVPVNNNYRSDKVWEVCSQITTATGQTYCIEKSVEVLLNLSKPEAIDLCDHLSQASKSCRDKMTQYYCSISSQCPKSQ